MADYVWDSVTQQRLERQVSQKKLLNHKLLFIYINLAFQGNEMVQSRCMNCYSILL